MNTDVRLASDLIDKLDEWTNKLAAPLLPPVENAVTDRLEFSEHTPRTVMIGKCVRAVSGIHAALALVELGYVAECAAIMRMVSDFCSEIITIGIALQSGAELPDAVRKLVEGYFVLMPRTLEDFRKTGRPRYPSRNDLMKVETRWAKMVGINNEQWQDLPKFLNTLSDAHVHGAYETTMELYDPRTGYFRMRGFESRYRRRGHFESVILKLHEVVVALQFTASVTGHQEVWNATQDARRALDTAGWSASPSCDS